MKGELNKYTKGASLDLVEEVDEYIITDRKKSFKSVFLLLRRFRAGYAAIFAAIPITIIRSAFNLLICFQISDFLEAYSKCSDEEKNDYVFKICSIYIGLIIIKTIFVACGSLLVSKYGHGFCSFLRIETLRSILRQGGSYFDEEKNSPGRLTHRLIQDTSTLDKMVESKLDLLIPSIVCAVFGLGVALFINWRLALLCGFQFPVYLAVRIIQMKQGSKRQRKMLEEEKKAANLTTVVLTNMSTIKAYGLQGHFYGVFEEKLEPLSRSMRWQSLISSFVFASEYSFIYILISVTLSFGRDMMLTHDINLLEYIKVVLLTQFGASLFSQLVASISDLTKAKIAAENIMEVLEERPRDVDNLTEEGLRPVTFE